MAQRAMAETCSSTASSSSEAPVDMWIELMRQILTKDNHNIISRVLKYIALFDYRTDKQINLE